MTDALPSIAVSMSTFDGRSAIGAMQVRDLGTGERLWRALRALGFCWLLAVGAVLIPLLHWVLVPGLFLAGFVVAGFAFQRIRIVAGGTGPCPTCATALNLRAGSNPHGFGQA
ncbi:MAG: hypothetical protein H0X45_03345, partial [Planctomycetes bacterium]|nr:hypothetical protein [Planctomycetota bacterium]